MEVFSHQPIPIQLKRERKVWHNESFSHMLLAHLISGTCTWREGEGANAHRDTMLPGTE